MNGNNTSGSIETQKDIIDIILRLFYLRRRFRGKMPEQMLNVKASIQEHNLREKIEHINGKNVFFTIGFVFSRQSEPITMGELSRIMGVPFSTATPNRTTNPTDAGTDRYCPERKREKTPPIRAKGRLEMTRSDRRIDLKVTYRSSKIKPMATGPMIINLFIALC